MGRECYFLNLERAQEVSLNFRKFFAASPQPARDAKISVKKFRIIILARGEAIHKIVFVTHIIPLIYYGF